MRKTYSDILDEVGLKTLVVESDNGYIGGEYCHEFVVESEAGESRFLVNPDLSLCAHVDIATFIPDKKNVTEAEKPLQILTVPEGSKKLLSQ